MAQIALLMHQSSKELATFFQQSNANLLHHLQASSLMDIPFDAKAWTE